MRIVFLCGCLEPGKDGVGDYTRRLAVEFIRSGINIGVIALRDPFIKGYQEDLQSQEEINVPVLRLGRNLKRTYVTNRAKKWIDLFDPDWISLQFVPFAFQAKGLPWFLSRQLKIWGEGRKCHIMFHELWLGEAKSDPLKHRIVGGMQKWLVKMLLTKINPLEIFTSNYFYHDCLEKIGVKADIVPLFSNIPLGRPNRSFLFGRLPKKVRKFRKSYIIASFFGSILFSNELENKMLRLKNLTQRDNKKLMVTHIGRSEGVTKKFKEWNNRLGIETMVFGMQEALSIADYFREIDVGLSTYPKILLEKSGSIAAMNFNKLPVILLRKSFLEDKRNLSWIKDIEEISHLSKFLSSAKPYISCFRIEYTIMAYNKALSHSKLNLV